MSIDDDQSENLPAALKPPFLLCLFLEGFGIAPATEVNAVSAAKMPNFFKYIREYPVSLLSGATKDYRRRYWSLGSGLPDEAENFLKADTCLSEVLSLQGLRQIKIVASEQLPGLSIFFNNNKEIPYGGEDYVCLSTPAPEETLRPLGKEVIRAISEACLPGKAEIVFASLPLAHEASARGDFKETVNNLQQIDKLLPKIITPILNREGLVIITAPFGNAERTRNLAVDWEDREPTASPVPFLLIGEKYQGKTIGLADPLDGDLSILAPAGSLADFAPTVLSLLEIQKPASMSGKSLL